MKHLTTCIMLLAIFCLQPSASQACTNLIVGKKASADGSVMITYNADDYGSYGYLRHYPAAHHPQGTMRKLYHYETNNYLGEIPEAEYTYNVMGQINEHQLSIMETTFGGREELVDSTGLMDYGELMYVTLQRAKTAREAISVMTKLVEDYGYQSEGESITIADPKEAWVLEIIGKGPGRKGAVWVALRLPDDCITAHANQARITTFPLKDKENCLYAKDVIKVAREHGWFSGKDKDFNFRDAYAPLDFGARRICEARVWSFFNHHCKGMERYLPYVLGIDKVFEEMPWCVRPDAPVSLHALKMDMRDHYEGTVMDMTQDVGMGPYEAPYRQTPLYFQVDSVKYFNERPISTQQTGTSYVAQMRSWLPDHIGGVLWFGCDDANMLAYTPVYCCATAVPPCYDERTADAFHFSMKSAFWLQNCVANIIYARYCQLFPELQSVRDRLEQQFESQQAGVEARAQAMDQAEAVRLLTSHTAATADAMMQAWTALFERIQVKYNDFAVKPEADGQFKATPGGVSVPLQRPGFPEHFRRRIVSEEATRYRVPE